MLLWFAGGALAIVWSVFRDPRLDHRLLIAGALLPDVVDGVGWRGVGPMHTLAVNAALLAGVVLVTIGRRSLRRRLLAVPMGTLAHVVLDGVWARTKTFWWPFLGGELDGSLPTLDRPVVLLVVLELLGAVLLVRTVRQRREAMAA